MSDKKIVYTTTGTLIVPYTHNQCQRLEFETSDFDKIYHKQIPHTGFYNKKLEIFATYKMYATKLKSYFPDYDIEYFENYKGKSTSNFAMKVKPNKYQNSALTQLMGINGHEAYINIPTASGKTVLAVTYICMYKKKAFIMCYSSRILEQWEDTFRSKTTLNPDRVFTFNSSEKMNDFLTGKKSADKYDIFLCTSKLFDSFGNRYGYENYQRLFRKLGVGLKVIDEAHTRLGSTIRCNAYTSIDMTLYLSADYNQANPRLMEQFTKVFRMVPVIKLEEELMSELRHINAVTLSINSDPTLDEMLKVTGGKYHWSHIDYCRYEFEKGVMQTAIKALVSEIIYSMDVSYTGRPYKILILLQLIEHTDIVYDLLLPIVGDRSISKYHSMVEDKSTALDADIIVSTYKSFSTGLDVTNPQIKHVISTCPVDVVTANQSAGRCRPIPDEKSYFWMIQDFGFEYCGHNNTKVVKYLKTNKIGSYQLCTLRGDKIDRS